MHRIDRSVGYGVAACLLLAALLAAGLWVQRYTALGIFALGGASYWIERAAEAPDAEARGHLARVLSATQYGVNQVENRLSDLPAEERDRLLRLLVEQAPNERWRQRFQEELGPRSRLTIGLRDLDGLYYPQRSVPFLEETTIFSLVVLRRPDRLGGSMIVGQASAPGIRDQILFETVSFEEGRLSFRTQEYQGSVYAFEGHVLKNPQIASEEETVLAGRLTRLQAGEVLEEADVELWYDAGL